MRTCTMHKTTDTIMSHEAIASEEQPMTAFSTCRTCFDQSTVVHETHDEV